MLSPRVGDRFERTWDRNKHNCFGLGVNSCYKTVFYSYQLLIIVEIFWKRRGFGLKNGSDEEEEKKKC